MAIGKQIEESLKDAESSLRNALAFAARTERPLVCTSIAKLIKDIEHLQTFDNLVDLLENHKTSFTDVEE
jgi:hypothetical protein